MAPVIWILAGIAALLVVSNWDDVVNWIEKVFDRVKAKLEELWEKFKNKIVNRIADIIVNAIIKIVVWIIGKTFNIEITSFVGGYALPNGQWIEEEAKNCEIDVSEVPEWAKAGVGGYKKDVTKRYMEKLSLTL